MIVRVLGSAAGGGVPQWNCACANCAAARGGRQPRRSSSSFAFSKTGERWWLVNVSPDIAQQIEAHPPLTPREGRGTPIAGMLLTDANVDHIGGFAVLRQAGEHRFQIYSSATVRDIATAQAAFAPFAAAPHVWDVALAGGTIALEPGLTARVVTLAGLTPGYAGRRDLPDAVVGYHVIDDSDGAGASVLFAPVFMDVTDGLLAAARTATAAFFDGSFWSDDELGGVGLAKAARALGHAPIGGVRGSLTRFRALAPGARRFYAHVNNTNPILDAQSVQSRQLADAGFEVAADGLVLDLGAKR
ncbi:MAG: pyrroloquinoline quinone biosynthesis protein PqqB [Vulcanimicrobiaceae bacterium]